MLSRKHYVAIAAEIKSAYDDHDVTTAKEVICTLAERLAVIFKEDNPNFDRNRFLEACGV